MADHQNRINGFDPNEVEAVHEQFPHLFHEEIVEAIQTKGPDRKAVFRYLKDLDITWNILSTLVPMKYQG